MQFQKAVETCFSKYADFSGRAVRSEYWWFYLFTLLLGWGGSIADSSGVVGMLVELALLLPSSAAGARRLHDTGRSGWWLLIALTCVGLIPLVIWLASEGTRGENAYGADPRETEPA